MRSIFLINCNAVTSGVFILMVRFNDDVSTINLNYMQISFCVDSSADKAMTAKASKWQMCRSNRCQIVSRYDGQE